MKNKKTIPEETNVAVNYREMLEEKRNKLMSGGGAKFDTLATMGRVAEEDQAQITHEEFISLHLNALDFVQLRLVEEALDRLASGHYGICLACDEPIPPKRLRALPWARYCVPCQDEAGRMGETEILESRSRMPVRL